MTLRYFNSMPYSSKRWCAWWLSSRLAATVLIQSNHKLFKVSKSGQDSSQPWTIARLAHWCKSIWPQKLSEKIVSCRHLDNSKTEDTIRQESTRRSRVWLWSPATVNQESTPTKLKVLISINLHAMSSKWKMGQKSPSLNTSKSNTTSELRTEISQWLFQKMPRPDKIFIWCLKYAKWPGSLIKIEPTSDSWKSLAKFSTRVPWTESKMSEIWLMTWTKWKRLEKRWKSGKSKSSKSHWNSQLKFAKPTESKWPGEEEILQQPAHQMNSIETFRIQCTLKNP